MKLLVDARTGWGHGIGRTIANTVPQLARLRPDWHIDTLVPPDQAEAAEAAFAGTPNVHLLPCPIVPFSMGEQTRLQRHVRGHDLTWFTNYWVPLGWRTPFVATVHDILHLLPDLIPASPIRRQLSRLTFEKVRRSARAVMFVSRFTESEFRRIVGDPRMGAVVENGGDHLRYDPSRPVAERTRRLVVVAASKKHKNFALLFDAWRKARLPDHWVLTIVTPRAMLLSSVEVDTLAGQDQRIDIKRGISNDELAALYADSAILLMPSLYEGFGLPLVEGMLAGALCVSSNAGSLVEVAQGGFVQFVNGTDRPGWTAAIEDACAMIDRGRPDLDQLLRHNAACAARFRWEQTARKVASVLEAAAA